MELSGNGRDHTLTGQELYEHWASVTEVLAELRARAAAGSEEARVQLEDAGPAMQAEIDRLEAQSVKIINDQVS